MSFLSMVFSLSMSLYVEAISKTASLIHSPQFGTPSCVNLIISIIILYFYFYIHCVHWWLLVRVKAGSKYGLFSFMVGPRWVVSGWCYSGALWLVLWSYSGLLFLIPTFSSCAHWTIIYRNYIENVWFSNLLFYATCHRRSVYIIYFYAIGVARLHLSGLDSTFHVIHIWQVIHLSNYLFVSVYFSRGLRIAILLLDLFSDFGWFRPGFLDYSSLNFV